MEKGKSAAGLLGKRRATMTLARVAWLSIIRPMTQQLRLPLYFWRSYTAKLAVMKRDWRLSQTFLPDLACLYQP